MTLSALVLFYYHAINNIFYHETQALIRPFVEAVFQGNFARTSVAESANPSWNEELVLPFRYAQLSQSKIAFSLIQYVLSKWTNLKLVELGPPFLLLG